MTNAERIRAMSDEELLEWIEELDFACMGDKIRRCKKYKRCCECWKDWLAEDADGVDCSDGSDESKKQGDER